MIKEWLMKLFKIEVPKPVSKEELEAEKKQKKREQIEDKYFQGRGERLSAILEHLNLSKEELKEKLDMSESSIDSLVTDPQEFLKDVDCWDPLYKLTTGLNVNPDYLVAGVGEMLLSEEEARAIRNLNFCAAPEVMFTMMTYAKQSKLLCLNIATHFQIFLFEYYHILINEIEHNTIETKKMNP